MLLNDFYTLKAVEATGADTYTAYIALNPAHEIFRGHFPDGPVTPGVCMMQIIKEITQHVINAPLTLQSASNVKFTALINPEVNPNLRLNLELQETEEGLVKVKNTSYFDETVALKLSCIFIKNS